MSAAEGEAWGLNQAIDWLISLDLNWVIYRDGLQTSSRQCSQHQI